MTRVPPAEGVRLAELLGVLSLGADLGMGQPMEHVLRQTLIALHLGDKGRLSESEQRVVFYASLIAWVGCHVDAYEQAKWLGDDLALKSDFRQVDLSGSTTQMIFIARHLGAGQPMRLRTALGVDFARGGGGGSGSCGSPPLRLDIPDTIWDGEGELTKAEAERIRLYPYLTERMLSFSGSLAPLGRISVQYHERLDGSGYPRGLAGDATWLLARCYRSAKSDSREPCPTGRASEPSPGGCS